MGISITSNDSELLYKAGFPFSENICTVQVIDDELTGLAPAVSRAFNESITIEDFHKVDCNLASSEFIGNEWEKEFMNNLKINSGNKVKSSESEIDQDIVVEGAEEISLIDANDIEPQCTIVEALKCADKLIQFSKIQKESYPSEILQTLEVIRSQIMETKQRYVL